MAQGPLMEKVMEKLRKRNLGEIEDKRLKNSPLFEDHMEKLKEEMKGEAGGCCNAFEAAQIIREDERKFR